MAPRHRSRKCLICRCGAAPCAAKSLVSMRADRKIAEGVIMAGKKRDAVDQLIDKFVGDGPERQAILDEEIVNVEAAQLVLQPSKEGGTQPATASVICRMLR